VAGDRLPTPEEALHFARQLRAWIWQSNAYTISDPGATLRAALPHKSKGGTAAVVDPKQLNRNQRRVSMAVKKSPKKTTAAKKSSRKKPMGKATRSGRRLKFPEMSKYPLSEPAVMCPAERVIGLYNENSGKTAAKVSATVRTWFESEAPKHGWAGVHFVKDVQSGNGAGCILSRPPVNVGATITITQTTLVLP
jgi:hypothetical protein